MDVGGTLYTVLVAYLGVPNVHPACLAMDRGHLSRACAHRVKRAWQLHVEPAIARSHTDA